MNKLKPISPERLSESAPQEKRSTDSPLAKLRHVEPLRPISAPASLPPPLTGKFRTSSPRPRRTLDFDIETRAAGFGDPNWVPQSVTAIAWSWVDEDEIHVRTLLQGFASMVDDFLAAHSEATMLTGHNLLRFDLPVLQADLLRQGYRPLPSKLVQDTIRIVKTKGFKKGQDNLSTLVRSPEQKMPLNWQEWDDAYNEPGWPVVIERVVSDVRGHKLLRAEMLRRGWIKPAVRWAP